ncbi:MAG: helix-turn-helix domain-containing protein [Clostridia bacterium]|nr:helix-turn-helix domain-containing protein [Clostridia bacterium]
MQQQEALIDQLISNICQYLDDLREKKIQISVHILNAALTVHWHRFLPYNLHQNAYCLSIKESTDAWNHCIKCQKRVLEKAQTDGAYVGACWAGCREAIFPLSRADGKTIAFLSVSGYAAPKEVALPRIARASRDFSLSSEKLMESYASLRSDEPDMAHLRRVIAPLQHMFTLLIEYHHALCKPQMPMTSTVCFYEQLLEYINRHFAERITLRNLSEKYHCSYSCISHLFRQFGNETFTQALSRVRMDAARKYLEYTRQSVTEIAFSCGFEDPNYFSSAFRRENGLSPTAWRDRYCGQPYSAEKA